MKEKPSKFLRPGKSTMTNHINFLWRKLEATDTFLNFLMKTLNQNNKKKEGKGLEEWCCRVKCLSLQNSI